MAPEPLFLGGGDLRPTLEALTTRARKSVESIPEASFKAQDPSEVATKIFAENSVAPIELTEGAISVSAGDADIDRRRIPDMDWGFPGESPTIRGTRVTYSVPFTGDAGLFKIKPSRWTTSVPYATVGKNELLFSYDVQTSAVVGTKSMFEKDLASTKQWLSWGREEVDRHNSELVGVIEQAVDARTVRHVAASEGLAALGLPIATPGKATIVPDRPATQVSKGAKQIVDDMHFDVALSFAGEDRAYVKQVADHLVARGVSVFYDEFQAVNLWGKDLVAHLQDIYQNRAEYCVMFVSQHYVSKPWPRHERKSAQARALFAKEEYLLPARFDGSTVPGLPPTVGYVELEGLEPEKFAEMIIQKLGRA
jgi:hypothetical protein